MLRTIEKNHSGKVKFALGASGLILVLTLVVLVLLPARDDQEQDPPSKDADDDNDENDDSDDSDDMWTPFQGECASRVLPDAPVSWTLSKAKKECLTNPSCVAVVANKLKGKYQQRGTYCDQKKKPKWWDQSKMCDEQDDPIMGAECTGSNTFWLSRKSRS